MIDRYSISASAQTLAHRFAVDVPPHVKPCYNACPAKLLPVITHHCPQGVSTFFWGLVPQWAKAKAPAEKLINTKAESILEKPALQKKLLNYRCIVPADGFYAWKKLGKKTSVPYRFFLKDEPLTSFGGLWEEYEDEHGEVHHTFSIITVPSLPVVAKVGERMPLLLKEDDQRLWLNKETSLDTLLKIMITPDPALQLDSYTVSPQIKSANTNDPSLLLPAAPADQFGNLTLFD